VVAPIVGLVDDVEGGAEVDELVEPVELVVDVEEELVDPVDGMLAFVIEACLTRLLTPCVAGGPWNGSLLCSRLSQLLVIRDSQLLGDDGWYRLRPRRLRDRARGRRRVRRVPARKNHRNCDQSHRQEHNRQEQTPIPHVAVHADEERWRLRALHGAVLVVVEDAAEVLSVEVEVVLGVVVVEELGAVELTGVDVAGAGPLGVAPPVMP
jgi:hypothetical protein